MMSKRQNLKSKYFYQIEINSRKYREVKEETTENSEFIEKYRSKTKEELEELFDEFQTQIKELEIEIEKEVENDNFDEAENLTESQDKLKEETSVIEKILKETDFTSKDKTEDESKGK